MFPPTPQVNHASVIDHQILSPRSGCNRIFTSVDAFTFMSYLASKSEPSLFEPLKYPYITFNFDCFNIVYYLY